MVAYSWDPGDVPRPSLGPRGRKNSVRTEMWLRAGGGCILSITGNGVGGRAVCVALEMLQATAHLCSARGWGDGSVSNVLDL